MSAANRYVTIKGVRDGLVFILDDSCLFSELLKELRFKLEKSHSRILSGPDIQVDVKLGGRIVTEEQKEEIRNLIVQVGNLSIQSIESDEPVEGKPGRSLKTLSGIVRSGQTLHHDGNLIFFGDVNPGGTIVCTGDIYVMGALRGMAHAGVDGDVEAVIAASLLQPTQLRIADVISRPPEEWGVEQFSMEYAYLKDGKMEIDKLTHFHRMRPTAMEYRGV